MSSPSPDTILIHNLEKQLERLMEQIQDLEECRNEITENEYDLMKQETQDQILEFEISLEKLQNGNISVDTRLSTMKEAIRKAIIDSFNTSDLKNAFEKLDNLDEELLLLKEKYRLKKIDQKTYFNEQARILEEIIKQGRPISDDDREFLTRYQQNPFYNALEKIEQ